MKKVLTIVAILFIFCPLAAISQDALEDISKLGIDKGEIKIYEQVLKVSPQWMEAATLSIKVRLNWLADRKVKTPDGFDNQYGTLDETYTINTRIYRYHPDVPGLKQIIIAPYLQIPSTLLAFTGNENTSEHGSATMTYADPNPSMAGMGGSIYPGNDKFTVQFDSPSWELKGTFGDGESAFVVLGGGHIPPETFTFGDVSLTDLMKGNTIERPISFQGPGISVQGSAQISLICHILDTKKMGRDYDIKTVMPPANATNPIAVTDPIGMITFKKSWWDNSSKTMRSAFMAHESAHVRQFQSNWQNADPWASFLWEYDAYKTQADYVLGCLMKLDSLDLKEDETEDILNSANLIYQEDGTPVNPLTVFERLTTEYGYDFYWMLEI